MPKAAAKAATPRKRPVAAVEPDSLLAQEEWPEVSRELLERLERTFRTEPMRPGQALDDAMFKSGQVALVRLLREVYEAQRRPEEA